MPSRSDLGYGPLSETPKSTGCSAWVSQRQPLSIFWNANAFSIRSRLASDRLSLLAGDGLAFPDFGSQQVPVQLDATGLQTANGESTIIPTSAVTSALRSLRETRVDAAEEDLDADSCCGNLAHISFASRF